MKRLKDINYKIGIFVTDKSSKELINFVKSHRGNNQIAYIHCETRKEAIDKIAKFPNEKAVIYMPKRDSYVTEHFKSNFLNLEDSLGILMFDENRKMLSKINEGLAFKDNILLTNDNKIKRNVKFYYDENRFITGVKQF